MKTPNRPPIDSKFEAQAAKQRFTIKRAGKVLAGTDSLARAETLLSVLSRDGELPGYELVTRGAR